MNPSARFRVFENSDSACARAADGIAHLIREHALLGRKVVLGLVAGETSLPFFNELIYRHREEGLSLGNVVTFNTDAYAGVDGSHPASLQSFMQRHLFDHVDIPPDGIHFPPVTGDPHELEILGAGYEAAIKKPAASTIRSSGCVRTAGLDCTTRASPPTDARNRCPSRN